MRLLDDLASDLGYAWRTLRRSPGFTVVAALTIALGVGGTTAVFSLADEALLRTLPVRAPQELVFVKVTRSATGLDGSFSYPLMERFRAHSRSLGGIAAYATDHMPLVVEGSAEQVFVQIASGGYFDLLGVRAVLGRTLTADDERLQPAVAVISHQYWQRRFSGSPDVLGTVVRYEDRPVTIVGVTAPSFRGLELGDRVDITVPITTVGEELLRDARRGWWFRAVARLAPGATAEGARSELESILHGFLTDVGAMPADRRTADRVQLVSAARGGGGMREQLARPIWLLLALMGAVLTIACTNVANLLLARGAARQRELAIRAAIGAGRLRLVRQLLTESLLLFTLGAAGGTLVAAFVAGLLSDFLAIGRLPILLDLAIDGRVLAFTAGVCLLTGLLSGLAPALRASRGGAPAELRSGAVAKSGTRATLPVSRWLVIVQVAASVVILVGGMLLVRTLGNLRSVDAGFRADGVLIVSVRPLSPALTAGERDRLFAAILERAERLPGVQSASISVLTPLSGRDRTRRVEAPGLEQRAAADAHINVVSPAYFDTFRIPLRRGRPFSAHDDADAPSVAVINEAAARFYLGARDPIGARLALDSANGEAIEVVGVVADVRHHSLRDGAPRFVYLPFAQAGDGSRRRTLAVRARGEPLAALGPVRGAVEAIDREILVSDVMTMEQQLDQALLRERLVSALSTAFGALGLLLAAIGLYGLASYAVVRRTGEIGIRMALGASPRAIRTLMLRDGLRLVALGVAIGMPLSLLAARAMRAMLYGVSPADPVTVAASLGLLGAVAGLAAYLPARRASRVDPMVALRES